MKAIDMKIYWVAALGLALSIGVAASSSSLDLPPPAVRDEGMTPVARVRQLAIPALRSIPGSTTCRIDYTDRYFGYLGDRQYSLNYKMRLQSACYEAKNVKWLNEFPVRFDPVKKEWVSDIERRLDWAASAGGQEGVDPEYRKLRRNALRAYTLKSVNAQGFAFTEEEVIGDEKSRTRYLDYCLFYAEVALCGRGDVGYVAEGPKGDLTDYVLQILRSIEFLPVLPPAATSASAAASDASASTR